MTKPGSLLPTGDVTPVTQAFTNYLKTIHHKTSYWHTGLCYRGYTPPKIRSYCDGLDTGVLQLRRLYTSHPYSLVTYGSSVTEGDLVPKTHPILNPIASGDGSTPQAILHKNRAP